MNFLDKIVDLFKGRLNRRNYLIGIVLVSLLEFISSPRALDAVYFALAMPVILTFRISISVRRAYDLGWSKKIIKLLILWLILDVIFLLVILTLPEFGLATDKFTKGIFGLVRIFVTVLPLLILSLILLFKRGQSGPNQYGDPPSPNIRFPQDLLEGSGLSYFNKPKPKI